MPIMFNIYTLLPILWNLYLFNKTHSSVGASEGEALGGEWDAAELELGCEDGGEGGTVVRTGAREVVGSSVVGLSLEEDVVRLAVVAAGASFISSVFSGNVVGTASSTPRAVSGSPPCSLVELLAGGVVSLFWTAPESVSFVSSCEPTSTISSASGSKQVNGRISILTRSSDFHQAVAILYQILVSTNGEKHIESC